MKSITAGFRIPSLRDVCEKNDAPRSSDAAAAVQTLAIPYAVGKATLQLTGIHVRLQPLKAVAKSASTAVKSHKQRDTASSSTSAPAALVVGAIAADIVVHAHVRGAMDEVPRSFVVAVVPVRYDASHNVDDAASSTTSASPPAPVASYDKRVLNAQAREARRGVVAPVFPSSFAKVDLRTQMERVRLSFTVVPVGKLSKGVVHHGKRSRAEDEAVAEKNHHAAQENPQLQQLVDCLVDVTVVGTVSPIL